MEWEGHCGSLDLKVSEIYWVELESIYRVSADSPSSAGQPSILRGKVGSVYYPKRSNRVVLVHKL